MTNKTETLGELPNYDSFQNGVADAKYGTEFRPGDVNGRHRALYLAGYNYQREDFLFKHMTNVEKAIVVHCIGGE